MTAIIQARGLVKSFGSLRALDGLDLDVHEGTVLGLLGPNGSGKTTTVSILTTLDQPDAGSAVVAGADVLASPNEVRKRIGLSGQYAPVDENLTGFENLDMIGRLYRLGRQRAKARAWELLERLELTEVAQRPAKTYSGGMRRRLDLELKATVGGERIELLIASEADADIAIQTLGLFALDKVQQDGRTFTAAVDGGTPTLGEALRAFAAQNIELRDVGLRRPSLDDVFLTLTGREANTAADQGDESQRPVAA